MNRYRLTQRGMRETDDPPHPLDWVTLDECQRATGAVEAELTAMRGERDKLAERDKLLAMLREAMSDGLSGRYQGLGNTWHTHYCAAVNRKDDCDCAWGRITAYIDAALEEKHCGKRQHKQEQWRYDSW